MYVKIKSGGKFFFVKICDPESEEFTPNGIIISIINKLNLDIEGKELQFKDRDGAEIDFEELPGIISQYRSSSSFFIEFCIDGTTTKSINIKKELESYLKNGDYSAILNEYSAKKTLSDSSRRCLVREAINFLNEFVFSKLSPIDINKLNFEVKNYLYNTLNLTEASKVFSTNKIELTYGYIFRLSFVLYIGKESEFLIFGKIKQIYIINEQPYLYLDMYKAKKLNRILNSYELTSQNISKMLSFKNILFLRPYESYVINSREYLLTPDILEQ